ncbi:MAG: protocatechuate 3,4-dioxygenase beta subunit [Pseudohongiellaceae bacterium]|jgi:protocatechuate 3,4-dioxygenase beta subunit
MAKPTSPLPIILCTLLVLAAAAAAGLFLLPSEHPEKAPPTVVSLLVEAEEITATADIDAFQRPADQPQRPNPAAVPQLGSLSGQLLNPDRRPVPGGRIELLEGNPSPLGGTSSLPRLGPRCEVGPDGRFEFQDVPVSDRVVVRAIGDQFATTESGPHVVRAGETCQVGMIIVAPGLTVHGTISDARGRGIQGAQVGLSRGLPLAIGRDGGTPERIVVSDENGRYLIPHASQGPFQLIVSAAGFGNSNIAQGVILGQPTDVEINVHLQLASPLSGVVLLPGGEQPAVHVEVLAQGGEQGMGADLVRTDSEGRFLFEQLAHGPHRLQLDPVGYLPVSKIVNPEAADSEITILLREACSLSGTVTDSAGKPLKAFDLQLRQSNKRGNVGETVGASMRVRDSDGNFEVSDLVPGWYLVEVWARDHSVTLSDAVRVLGGSRPSYISVVMQQAASLAGAVTDDLGQPIPGAKVSLHSNKTPTSGFLRASAAQGSWHTAGQTDEDGLFKFETVTARTYQVEVDHPHYPMSHQNDVRVVEGQETVMEMIVLARPATLQGLVTDANGQVLKGIKVTLGGGTNRTTRDVISDGNGHYRFERLAPGKYQVHAYTSSAGPMDVLFSSIHRIKVGADGKPAIPEDVSLEPGEVREYRVIAQG